MPADWLIYGANGFSGRLIAAEAQRRGLRPVLAGRRAGPVGELAAELGLACRVFALEDSAACAEALDGIGLVLHCAGPFSATSRPMLEACLQVRAHYLDITGEIRVLEHAYATHEQAREAGVVVCAGVGFDVVPTDCVAATLKGALPDAVALALGFDTRSSLSPGTAKTSVEGLSRGGYVRRDGRITPVPLAYLQRRIDFGAGEKLAVTIPWGDVATAYHTTGIPDIEVYVPASPRLVKRLRLVERIRPVLGWGIVQRWLMARIDKRVRGPDAAQRSDAPTFVWGEARNADGEVRTARMRCANGYTVTVEAALAIVEHLLAAQVEAGSYTPSLLMGADFAATLPGSTPVSLS